MLVKSLIDPKEVAAMGTWRSVLHISPEFWDRKDILALVLDRNIPQLLRLVQADTRASQTDIGLAIGQSQAQVSEIISGARKVRSLDVLQRIANGLEMPDRLAAAFLLGRVVAPDDTIEDSGQHAIDRLPRDDNDAASVTRIGPSPSFLDDLDHARQGLDRVLAFYGTVSVTQLEAFEEAARLSARQCVTMPPVEMLQYLISDIAEIKGLLAQPQPPTTQIGLNQVAARLATLIADELMVLGDVRQSRAWHATASVAADKSGNVALQADVRTLSALLPIYYGDPTEAVAKARQAQAVAERVPNGLTSVLAPIYESLGHAQLSATAASESSLRIARERFESVNSEIITDSVFGFSERRWHFYLGKIFSYLGRSDEAWEIHDQALMLYPEDVVGDRALIFLDRSISLVRAGQVVAGCQLAQQTIWDLPPAHRTDIFVNAGRRVLTAIPTSNRSDPAVTEYRRALQSWSSSNLK